TAPLAAFGGSTAARSTWPAGATATASAGRAAAATGTLAPRALAATAASLSLAVPAIIPILFVASPAPLGRTGGQHDRDVGSPLGRPHHFNATFDLLGRAGRLDRGQREDFDPLQ